MISPLCSCELISSECLSTRIGKLVFDISYCRILMLSIYAPNAIDVHSNETMSFYNKHSSIVDANPSHGHLFLCGDFYAALPVKEVLFRNRCGEANHSTNMLQSFIERHDLFAANAFTKQKYRSLPTFVGPNWRKTRPYLIFCPLRCRFNLQKSITHRTSVITLDHHFVTASFSLKCPSRKLRYK